VVVTRFIDVRLDDEELPAEVVLATGDVVRVSATGGRIISGMAVELLGTLSSSVVGTDGSVLTPLGAPDTVLFRAVAPGRAVVEVMTGDPFGPPGARATHRVLVRVQP
jgi:hypothetical protein